MNPVTIQQESLKSRKACDLRLFIGSALLEAEAAADRCYSVSLERARRSAMKAAAKGGEILVANVVRELAEGKDFLFADRGEANLKGFDEPVRLYEVRWA